MARDSSGGNGRSGPGSAAAEAGGGVEHGPEALAEAGGKSGDDSASREAESQGEDASDALSAMLTEREILQAVENNGVGIWLFDAAADRVFWSHSMCRILGVEDADQPRTYAAWREQVHPEDIGRVEAIVQEALARGEYPDIEHRLVRKDGEVRHVIAKGIVERAHDGTQLRIIGTVIDVTNQRQLESQIREDMRLESLGRLAGGLAHEFNNMLTVILGSANLALDLIGTTGSVADNLVAIRDAAERSATITTQLLAFARRHANHPRPTDLTELVQRGLGLVRHLVGPHIQVVTELEAAVNVEVDPNQFQQVLMNLAANARDAMTSGGVLTVRVRREVRGRRPMARLEVEDDGVGIAPEVMPRVFEPFFSTKGPLGGAGLGLATVYGIVRQHGGHVQIDSQAGRGTCVVIELPASTRAPRVEGPQKPGGDHDTKGSRPSWAPVRALILLVDDEPRVRAVTSTLLRRLGHEVVEANDGIEALALAAVRPPDLVVTGLVMPRLGGIKLIAALREERPHLPAVVMTGFGTAGPGPAEDDGQELARIGDLVWVTKPYHPDLLAERVTTLLSSQPERP